MAVTDQFLFFGGTPRLPQAPFTVWGNSASSVHVPLIFLFDAVTILLTPGCGDSVVNPCGLISGSVSFHDVL